MTDVGELQGFLAVVQCRDGQADPADLQLFGKGVFVEVAEVLHAHLFEWDEHIAKGSVQQFNGGCIWCVRQAQRDLVGIAHQASGSP